MKRTVICLLILGLAAGGALAQTYKIDWYSINSGGGEVSGGGYVLTASIGQPVAEYTEGTNFKHWIGFWHPEDDQQPVVIESIREAKLLPDGEYISIAGKIATSDASHYSGFFYVEEADRSSGIRVSVAAWPVVGLAEGSIVNVIGEIGTTSDDERQIEASHVVIASSTTPLRPLGMINRSVGGADFGIPPLGQYGITGGVGVNNIGLLIQTWGRVRSAGSGWIVIDDGSGQLITVDTSTLASPPDVDDYVTIIGASSMFKQGSNRFPIILPRSDSDVGP